MKEAENLIERGRVCADLSIKLHHAHTIDNKGPGQNPTAPNVAPVRAGAVTKPDQELRPPKLLNDTTMGELHDWKDQFTSYYNSSNLRQMTCLQQQGYLLSTLDKDIGRHVCRVLTVTTPIFPTPGSDSCFSILTKYFAQRNPIHVRRQAFFSASQKEGQTVLDFCDQLRSLGNEGDLESLSVEGCFCLMYQLGIQDETLRRELCKIKNPSLAEFDTLLEAHTLMEASEKLRNKTAQANMTKGPQRKSPPNPNKIRLNEEERKHRKQFRGKCYRCGAGDHMIPQCKLPANVICNSCKGHCEIPTYMDS